MLRHAAARNNKGYVRETKWATVLRQGVGRDGQRLRLAQVMRTHYVPKRFAMYWREKAANPAFHAGELGGARHFLLSDPQERAAQRQLWREISSNPMQRMTDLARKLQNHGYPVNRRCDDPLIAGS
jgi:hypothetical protein